MRSPTALVVGCVLALACEAPVAVQQQDTEGGSESGSGTDASDDPGSGATPSSMGEDTAASTDAQADDGAGTAGHDGSGGGGGSGGGSGAGTGDVGPTGRCAPACEADADCCPFGALGCPGPAYPNNWSCADGACLSGGCSSDADCDGLLGLGPEECHGVAGVPTCVAPCDGGGCGPGTQCVGEADDATSFCAAPEDAPCRGDDDCDGAGTCSVETGICGCISDDDCEGAGMVCAGA